MSSSLLALIDGWALYYNYSINFTGWIGYVYHHIIKRDGNRWRHLVVVWHFFVVDGWEKKHGTGRQSLRPCELDGGLSCYDKITFLALVCDVVVDNIYSRLISRIRF